MNDKMMIKRIIKNATKYVNNGEFSKEEYDQAINKTCEKYGTEFVAECFVEMTKAGELA